MAGALAASSSCVVQAFVQQRELLAAHKDLGDAWRVNGLTRLALYYNLPDL